MVKRDEHKENIDCVLSFSPLSESQPQKPPETSPLSEKDNSGFGSFPKNWSLQEMDDLFCMNMEKVS